MSLELVRR